MKKDDWKYLLVVLSILGIFIVGRYAWAKLVYHDARCMWAECRISK